MRTYRITFSNQTHSYSEIREVPENQSHLYVCGEYIGYDSIEKHVYHNGISLIHDLDCPPVFKRIPTTRVLIEDITKIDYVSPSLDEVLL